ncbi:MAG: sigma 54-interacting transcriptional regulator [Pyrinomonadaceae bacterium]
MTLPRILIIDDQFANEADIRTARRVEYGLVEIDAGTSDEELKRRAQEAKDDTGEEPTAAAVFCSGQVRRGGTVENSVQEVLNAVRSGWPSPAGWSWALILLDVHFVSTPARDDDTRFGWRLLGELMRTWPDPDALPGNSELPIVMLTTLSRSAGELDASKRGARAYVEKNEEKGKEKDKLTRDRLRELLGEHGLIGDPSGKLVGGSRAMLKVLREARQVARMGAGNAMILGPQGAGKSALAEYIHRQSMQNGRGPAFVEYASSPAVKQLEYGHLFGYWFGAHDMAKESACGKAELAHKGTLFLDEVHYLASDTQQALLLFGRPDKETGTRWIRRLGNFPAAANVGQAYKSIRGGKIDSNTSLIPVDVLLLTASNQPIDDPEWRAEHGFDDSLYQRLATEYAGRPLRYPSLSRRKEDILLLFDDFLIKETRKIGGRLNEEGSKTLDAELVERLRDYSWPANVAQLQGVAAEVARNAKDFPDVFARHLPPLPHDPTRPAPPKPDPAPDVTPPPATTAHGLAEAERVLRSVQVPHSLDELRGQLPALEKAYSCLIKEVLEVTLKQMMSSHGPERFCLPAFKCLCGSEIKNTGQAYSKLLRLYKLFGKDYPPTPGSALAIALTKARENRTAGGGSDGDENDE